jgi:hypothetical protein
MITLPHPVHFALRANALTSSIHEQRGESFDPLPVLKLFNPVGAATWIATELYDDDDTLFGLADLGFGCPELGVFSLAEIAAVRLPFGCSSRATPASRRRTRCRSGPIPRAKRDRSSPPNRF